MYEDQSGEFVCNFFLNFSSVGKGPSMAGKAKNMPQQRTFLGGGEGVVERVTLPYPRRS